MNKFAAIVLVALFSVAFSAPVEQSEIAQLSKLMPCKDQQAGERVRHPGSQHKFLRCVSHDSFWIETCPDNLFFNAELDLCDWSVITRTTTEGPEEIIKFRPVLFRRNKTVVTHHRPMRPLDLSRVSVKVDQESQIFPGQEDIVDTLTPIRTGINHFGSKSSFTSRPNTVSNIHFKEEEEKIVDPSEFTALPSKKMTDEVIVQEPIVEIVEETTTERPLRIRTTTVRPVVRTTTERPVVRTTTERPVIVRRPVEVRPVEIETDEKIVEPRVEHHRERVEEVIVEEPKDKAVLIRNGNIVHVTPPKKFVEKFVRRPVEDVIEKVPVKEIIEEVPVKEEIEFTTRRTPVFTTTRGTFEVRKHEQLFKQLAEEIPGARVVSFNGKPVNRQF